MEELLGLFRFLVPYFAATPDEDVRQALTIAAAYRPACLTTGGQDAAQVWYAAGTLYDRKIQTESLGAGFVQPGIKSEKEGDVARTYGKVDGAHDPFGFWSEFDKLAAICGAGAITVGNRYGACCRGAYSDY